jgi:uncharacterized protein YjdB
MRVAAPVVAIAVTLGACREMAAPRSAPPIDCAVGSARVSPTEATLHRGDTLRVRAFVTPCPQDTFTPTFLWSSSDASVANVDSISGLVLAKSTGTATILGAATQNRAIAIAAVIRVVPQ